MPQSYGTTPNIAQGYLTELARQRGSTIRSREAIQAQKDAQPSFWERVGEAALGQVAKGAVTLGVERIAQEFPKGQADIAAKQAATKYSGLQSESLEMEISKAKDAKALSEATQDSYIKLKDAQDQIKAAEAARQEALRNIQQAKAISRDLAKFELGMEITPDTEIDLASELGQQPPQLSSFRQDEFIARKDARGLPPSLRPAGPEIDPEFQAQLKPPPSYKEHIRGREDWEAGSDMGWDKLPLEIGPMGRDINEGPQTEVAPPGSGDREVRRERRGLTPAVQT
ncbi:MAG TPA: hypothetical protein EYN66_09015, partial [Myxococcales bacterium]|nr:hypothetical protein [Myxococcales bacterium]